MFRYHTLITRKSGILVRRPYPGLRPDFSPTA